ncbi:MAG: hypothetical protein OXI35_16575 [Gemmatimonadota bacterium]|nr:hypothetical protein [Gemmatimonadota bacterium]
MHHSIRPRQVDQGWSGGNRTQTFLDPRGNHARGHTNQLLAEKGFAGPESGPHEGQDIHERRCLSEVPDDPARRQMPNPQQHMPGHDDLAESSRQGQRQGDRFYCVNKVVLDVDG